MDYDAVLAQVLALLQQEQRVAYRVLKRRLQLDDETLEDLKDDLIYAKKLAVDEDGRVLVWAGEASRAPIIASPVPPPATPDVSPAQGEVSPIVPPTPDAERRQLTVMFCDLVDSTALSGQLDPEDLREVVRAYQRVCSEVITRFDGHIAQLLGDGLLVYFGYPQAHEDDAQRAVRTGLGILAAIGDLRSRLKREKGITLALRLGIHTGLVVVGAMGGAGRQEQLALGEVPNLAARLQGLAQPNTLAVSEASYLLIHGYFLCASLGAHTLRGVAQPLNIYRVLSESGAQGRLDIAQPRGLTPLVGREQEVGLLGERWEQVKAGHGHVVLLTGEAGIGKSRLVQVLKDHVATEPHIRWECRSVEYAQNSALFPLVDLFQRLWRFEAYETPDAKLEKLTHALSQYQLPLETSVPLFAPLLSLSTPAHQYPPLTLSPQRQRQQTLETIVAILLELAERQPVLFIVEDLHWTDPSTLELLNLVIDQTPTASLLALLTCRPHFQPAWHHRSYLTEITVNRLSHPHVAQIVTRMTEGTTFPAAVLQQILDKTDGVPLFVEEMTKALLESGHLNDVAGHYELGGSLSTFTIPATLQDSLMARLDRLVTAKAVAQYAAVIGRQFAYTLLQGVSQVDEAMLQQALGRLVEAEIIYQRGVPPHTTYLFKHALIQEAAYQSLLRSTRQQHHQRIGQVLEAEFPETATTQPELLAHHYTEAGLTAQAIPYWLRAGQRAVGRFAYVEAISHLTKGLEVLKSLPDTPARAQHELEFQMTVAPALMSLKGHAAQEMEQAYARAYALCQQLGNPPQVFPVLFGLWRFYNVRAAFSTSHELATQCVTLAQRQHDPAQLLVAHYAIGHTLFWYGAFASARAHLEQALTHYEPQQHACLIVRYGVSTRVQSLFFTAWTLWMLGYPDQALQRHDEALRCAHESAHPFSLAFALGFAACLLQAYRDVQAVHARAEAAITLTTEQAFSHWVAHSTIMQGWAQAAQGDGEPGLVQMCQGLTAYQATGARLLVPYVQALIAEVYGSLRQEAVGLTVLAEAFETVVNTGGRFYEAELHRLKGELLQTQSSANHTEAETCFHHALSIARHQQAKSWELRAAMSLARLWQSQGKRTEAYALLAPIYGWFTEGFDTADLQEARALLETLA